MKAIQLITYIAEHPEYTKIVLFEVDQEMRPMSAIHYLASSTQSNYDDILYRINSSLEQNTLIVYRY